MTERLGQITAILLFVLMGLVAVTLRTDRDLVEIATRLDHAHGFAEADWQPPEPRCLPVCLRLAGSVVVAATKQVVAAAFALGFTDPAAFALKQPSPWGYHAHAPERVSTVLVPFVALPVAKLVMITPVLVLGWSLFRHWLARCLFALAFGSLLAGWPPLAVNALLTILASLRPHWPMGYYNFPQPILLFDWAGLGFVALLVLFLTREKWRWWQIAALAALGQCVFENMGFTTGVALAATTLLRRDTPRLGRTALLRLTIAGIASAATLAALLAIAFASGPATITLTGPADASASLYFRQLWINNGQWNFLWANVTAANFITLAILPILAGAVLGGLSAPLEAIGGEHHRQVTALAGGICGFAAALGVGLFLSGFGSDMGRQTVPLLTLTLLLVAKMVQGRVRPR